MKILSKLFKISVFLFCVISLLTACVLRDDNNEEVLKVGMECSYAPFNWTQPTDAYDAVQISSGWYACGYDVYMAKKIAEKLGKKLEIVKVDWDGLLPALTSGKIDAIIAGMSATEERKQAIDFTDNYYNSNIVLVVRKDGRYANAKSLDDLRNAKITGQLSTVHYELVSQIPDVIQGTAMDDFSSMVSAVTSGKIDGYVSEKPAARIAVHMNPSLKYIEFDKDKGFKYSQDETAIAIGVKKGNKLKDDINVVLSDIDEKIELELMDKAIGGATL